MTDLAEFLLARIAEDEAVAQPASVGSASWRLDDLNETVCWWPPERESVIRFERAHGLPLSDGWRGQTIESAGQLIAPHIARWDPARVLAECQAKRDIIDSHRPYEKVKGCCVEHDGREPITYFDCDVCCEASEYAEQGGGCRTLRLLALPYADHPGYREEWRP